MSAAGDTGRDLTAMLQRHHDLALHLHADGRPRWALEVFLGARRYTPPMPLRAIDEHLVHRLAPDALHDGPPNPEDAALLRGLADLLGEIGRGAARRGRQELVEQADALRRRIEAGEAGLRPREPLPPGAALGVFVTADGSGGQCAPLFVRLLPPQATAARLLGTESLDEASFQALRAALDALHLPGLDRVAIETLLLGCLGEVRGQSLQLTAAVAVIGLLLGRSVPAGVAFTGRLHAAPRGAIHVHDVEEVRGKARAALQAGCQHFFYPAAAPLSAAELRELRAAGLAPVAVTSLEEVAGALWPEIRYPAQPDLRARLPDLVRALRTPWRALGDGAFPPERFVLWLLSCVVGLAALLDERLVRAGVDRYGDWNPEPLPLPASLLLSLLALLPVVVTVRALFLLPAVAGRSGWVPHYWKEVLLLCAATLLCCVPIAAISAGGLRLDKVPRLANLGDLAKDLLVPVFAFVAVYPLSIGNRIRVAQQLQALGRPRLVRAFLQGQLGRGASLALLEPVVLALIAVTALGLALNWDVQNLLDMRRRHPQAPWLPWLTLHVSLRAGLMIAAVLVSLHFYQSRRQQLLDANPEERGR